MDKVRKNSVHLSIFLLCLFSFFLVNGVKVFADETVPWVGEYVQAGRLRYGLGFGANQNYKDPSAPIITMNPPNVQYVIEEKQGADILLEHQFLTEIFDGTGGLMYSAPFNIIENMDEYSNTMGANDILKPAGMVVFQNGGKKDPVDPRVITASGKKLDSKDYEVTLKMEANKLNTSILHSFTVKNISMSPKKFYPMKQVDTKIGDDDDVPVKSRGPNQGIYIESKPMGLKKTIYRLDYITDVDNKPAYYSGTEPAKSLLDVFGGTLDVPDVDRLKDLMNKEESDTIFSEGDTGFFMRWEPTTLKPGEEKTFSYAVGISAATTMKIDKTVNNLTSKDGLNRTGDILEYTINLRNDALAQEGLVTDNSIEDTLPKGVEKPSKIEMVKVDGQKEDIPISTAYDSSKHQINAKTENINGKETVKLIYQVKIKNESVGKTLVNAAKATGVNPNGGGYEIDAKSEVEVLSTGKVISKFEDAKGNKIAENKEVAGEIGKDYRVEPINVFGYTYKSTVGASNGKFTADDQIVRFIYDQKKMYDLNKSVVNSKGTNVNNGDVALEDTLTYTTDLVPNKPDDLTTEQKNTIYKDISITEIINANLEDPTDITLINGSGQKVGTAVFNPTDRTITATVTDADKVKITDSIKLTYKAKVKKETPMKTVVSQQAKSTVKYVQDDLVRTLDSNIVKSTVNLGELLIEKAPEKIEFGEVKIKNYETAIGSTIDQPLVVKDTAKNKNWKVTAKLTDEMTIDKGKANEHIISNSLYIRYKGVPTPMRLNQEVTVYQTDIVNTPLTTDKIEVTEKWDKDEAKDGIKLKTSKLPKKGTYEGTVEWALSNTQ